MLKKAQAQKLKELAGFPLASSTVLAARQVLVHVRAKLERVLDLTDPAVLAVPQVQAAGITPALLTRDGWWMDNDKGLEAPTQAIGRAAYEAGLHGLIRLSAASSDTRNLDVFVPKLPIGCGLELISPPRLASSWRE
jgi:hypothetical protein